MCFYPLQQGLCWVGWWALLWNSWGIQIPQPEDGSRKNSCPNSAGAEDLEMSPEITEWLCGSLELHFCLLLWTQNFLNSCCWVVLVCQTGLELSCTSPLASGMQWLVFVCTQKEPCPDFAGAQVGWVQPISQGWTWDFVGTCLQQQGSHYLSDVFQGSNSKNPLLGKHTKSPAGPRRISFGRRRQRMIMPGEFSQSLYSRSELQCLVLA